MSKVVHWLPRGPPEVLLSPVMRNRPWRIPWLSLSVLGLVLSVGVVANADVAIDRWVLTELTRMKQGMLSSCEACLERKGSGRGCSRYKDLREAYAEKDAEYAKAMKRIAREQAKGDSPVAKEYQAYREADGKWEACATKLPLWVR